MFKKTIIAVSLAILVVPALAQNEVNNRAGRYESQSGQSLTAALIHLSGEKYSAVISTTVPVSDKLPGCGGSLEGEVIINGVTATLTLPNQGFLVQEKESLQNSRFCKVNLKFLDEYTMELEEVSGCSYYHGASCSFSGTLMHEASGI